MKDFQAIAQTEDNVYRIHESLKSAIEEKIAALNKRAKKLRCGEIKLVYGKRTVKEVKDEVTGWIKYTHTFIDVTVMGEAPVIKGWKLLGVLDHITIPNKVIVSQVPGEKVPQKYFSYEPICEHCNASRLRNETFVLQHETGETKAVGRQCIKDFLGHVSPDAIVKYGQYLRILSKIMDEDSYGEGGSRYFESGWSAKFILALSVAVIRQFGYLSKAKAEERMLWSTASRVDFIVNPPRRMSEEERSRWEKLVATCEPTSEDEDKAEKIISWVNSQEVLQENEYMHNAKMIMESDSVKYKTFAIAVSLPASYDRAMGVIKERSEKKPSNWVGEIGKRYPLEAMVKSMTRVETQFGVSTLHVFEDMEGNILKWFGTNPLSIKEKNIEVKVGDKVQFLATIKKHSEWKGIKQTDITRCAGIAILG